MADITIETGDGRPERYSLAKERVTIGRSRESDIFLPDQWLSRHHAEIRRRESGFFVHDLGSKNGTLHNGQPVSGDRRLRHGDVITLGEHVLTFSESEVVEEEPSAPPEGTRIFSARELSDIKTKPTIDPDELMRQNRVLMVLKEATETLIAHRPLPELFEKILDLLFSSVPCERAAILLHDGDRPVIKASRARAGQTPPTKVSRSIARRVLERRETLLVPNLMEDAAFSTQDSILSTGIRSALCAPLWFTSTTGEQDAVIGLVYLDSLARSQSFGVEDARIVTALANVAAAKIENSRLLEESLEKRRLEEDMRVAAEIQRGLLPHTAPTVPGYGVVGSNRPCRTVGGDYYDFGVTPDHLLLALGDVSGKGTGAALLMTVLRASVRGAWDQGSVADALCRINVTVCQNVTAGKYVTFFMARLDPGTGRVTYVNAGHNPPLLVRADGRRETLTEGGMVLGLFESVPYGEGTTRLEAGDVLVIYSDGVTETFNADDDEYGEEKLADIVTRERGQAAAAIQEAILSELETFAAGAPMTDDRTLIVVKRD